MKDWSVVGAACLAVACAHQMRLEQRVEMYRANCRAVGLSDDDARAILAAAIKEVAAEVRPIDAVELAWQRIIRAPRPQDALPANRPGGAP